jgi:hypothetical protein
MDVGVLGVVGVGTMRPSFRSDDGPETVNDTTFTCDSRSAASSMFFQEVFGLAKALAAAFACFRFGC